MDVRSSLELKVSQKPKAKEEAEKGQKNCKGNKSQTIYLALNSSWTWWFIHSAFFKCQFRLCPWGTELPSFLLASQPTHREYKLVWCRGRSWWLSSNESALRGRRHGFLPWSGKIPHTAEQLSSCATTIEPVLWSLGTTTTDPTHPNYTHIP